jgi:hypothetical protein
MGEVIGQYNTRLTDRRKRHQFSCGSTILFHETLHEFLGGERHLKCLILIRDMVDTRRTTHTDRFFSRYFQQRVETFGAEIALALYRGLYSGKGPTDALKASQHVK